VRPQSAGRRSAPAAWRSTNRRARLRCKKEMLLPPDVAAPDAAPRPGRCGGLYPGRRGCPEKTFGRRRTSPNAAGRRVEKSSHTKSKSYRLPRNLRSQTSGRTETGTRPTAAGSWRRDRATPLPLSERTGCLDSLDLDGNQLACAISPRAVPFARALGPRFVRLRRAEAEEDITARARPKSPCAR
jgi:hypothetical protein